MKLCDTVVQMNSTDYKERFLAEYNQLTIRLTGLKNMLAKWDSGNLDFTPTCPRSIYDFQVKSMNEYKTVLEARAAIEGIPL